MWALLACDLWISHTNGRVFSTKGGNDLSHADEGEFWDQDSKPLTTEVFAGSLFFLRSVQDRDLWRTGLFGSKTDDFAVKCLTCDKFHLGHTKCVYQLICFGNGDWGGTHRAENLFSCQGKMSCVARAYQRTLVHCSTSTRTQRRLPPTCTLHVYFGARQAYVRAHACSVCVRGRPTLFLCQECASRPVQRQYSFSAFGPQNTFVSA